MEKIKHITVLSLLAGMLGGCGAGDEHKVKEMDPIAVQIGTVQSMSNAEVVEASGRIEAVSSANISTRMMGNISRVIVEAGDQVQKGELLLVISSADLQAKKAQVQAAIVQAESGLKNAKKDYERFQVLHEKGSASKKELENMTTRFEMAKAGLEAAMQMEKEVSAQFDYTNLRAPFSGVVTNTFVKAGDIANPGMPLATVEGTTSYEAVVMVPESQISKIKKGTKASVLVKSKNQVIDGLVQEVSLSAKNTGGQYLVKIALNDANDILPGMFINATISTSLRSINTTPVITTDALIQSGQLTGVYTIGNDNTAILRWIRTGQIVGEQVEVLAGLKAGEQYVLKPEGKLYNGAKLSINN